MKKSPSLSSVARWSTTHTPKTGRAARSSQQYSGLPGLAASLILISILFSACTNPFGGSASNTPTTGAEQGLSTVHWCGKPLMVFRDEKAVTATATATTTPSTASTITNWSVVKSNLGFTVYLPTSLPQGACLVSAQATIHDAIYGGKGSFTIGYLLPDHTSLSFSEAPLKLKSAAFQCEQNATPTNSSKQKVTPTASAATTQLCSGAKDTTNIVIGGSGTVQHLQQIFDSLQPDVTWMPAS